MVSMDKYTIATGMILLVGYLYPFGYLRGVIGNWIVKLPYLNQLEPSLALLIVCNVLLIVGYLIMKSTGKSKYKKYKEYKKYR